VALLLGALSEWAVVFVFAKELIGAIAAVLDAVATLSVGYDFAADALEAVGQAGASDVVTNWAGADRENERYNEQSNTHISLFVGF